MGWPDDVGGSHPTRRRQVTLARAYAVALLGLRGHLVEVEADLADGLPGFTLVGLPDAALHESRDRVRAAVLNSGRPWPGQRRITVGLSPAWLPKAGSGFDLAMACAVLAADGQLPAARLHDLVLVGELALDGTVRPGRGVLPVVMATAGAGVRRVVVPLANAAEAALVPGITVRPVGCLRELVAVLQGHPVGERPVPRPPGAGWPGASGTGAQAATRPTGSLGAADLPTVDLADVVGQSEGRRAVEVAAAGDHHLFLLGPPGAGKTMLAERLPGLLPDLTADAALEVTALHSVAGPLPADRPLVTRPPFCQPHHTASTVALIGGGSGLPRPGVASLAHHGVLFLDEAPEFPPSALDALRQPLESGTVVLARAGGTAVYPARFTLVLAANPCPCGAAGLAAECRCRPAVRRRYLNRLSGPLLDRIDVRCELTPLSRAALVGDQRAEPSRVVADRVAAARDRAARRLAGTPWRTNAEVPGAELRRRFPVPAVALEPLHRDVLAGTLSARGLDRAVRVSWTLADLAGVDRPGPAEVAEARLFRLGAAVGRAGR